MNCPQVSSKLTGFVASFAIAVCVAPGISAQAQSPGEAHVRLGDGTVLPHPLPASQGWTNPRIPGVQGGGNHGDPRSGSRTHAGNDYPAPFGTPVYSSTSGTVRRSETDGGNHWGYGNHVRVEDAQGREHIYAHLVGENQPFSGQRINAGDRLGDVGRTGNASAMPLSSSHLHYEVRNPNAETESNPHGRIPVTSVRSNDTQAGFENYVNSGPGSTAVGAASRVTQPGFSTSPASAAPTTNAGSQRRPASGLPTVQRRQPGQSLSTASISIRF